VVKGRVLHGRATYPLMSPTCPHRPAHTRVPSCAGTLHLVGLALSEQRYLPGMHKIRRGDDSARQRGPVSLVARQEQE
jgi:hypothetical protein